MTNDWKKRLGVLYSTNPDYIYEYDQEPETETIPSDRQPLRVSLSRRHRAGKEVSLITGFIGSEDALQDLGQILKRRCGVGGSVKDGEIIIQGDQCPKLLQILLELGYSKSKLG